MRPLAFLVPLAAAVALAAPASAQAPDVSVRIGGQLAEKADELGRRDVDRQVQQLTQVVERALSRSGALQGATVSLVLTDLKPNRPTLQQAADRPGLSVIDSVSIGGATIEGEVITADGQRLPVFYARYSSSIDEVRGFGTWQDADSAYDRLAANLVSGRLVSR